MVSAEIFLTSIRTNACSIVEAWQRRYVSSPYSRFSPSSRRSRCNGGIRGRRGYPESMRILFLDDDANRARQVRPLTQPSWDFVWAATAADALKELDGPRFDLVCLDHDLAPEHYAGKSEDWSLTGRVVANKIAEMPEDVTPRFVLAHSMNEAGRFSMVATVTENRATKVAGAPFSVAVIQRMISMVSSSMPA